MSKSPLVIMRGHRKSREHGRGHAYAKLVLPVIPCSLQDDACRKPRLQAMRTAVTGQRDRARQSPHHAAGCGSVDAEAQDVGVMPVVPLASCAGNRVQNWTYWGLPLRPFAGVTRPWPGSQPRSVAWSRMLTISSLSNGNGEYTGRRTGHARPQAASRKGAVCLWLYTVDAGLNDCLAARRLILAAAEKAILDYMRCLSENSTEKDNRHSKSGKMLWNAHNKRIKCDERHAAHCVRGQAGIIWYWSRAVTYDHRW